MKLAVWRGRGRHHPSFFFGLVFLFSQLVVKQQKNWAPLGLSSVVEEIRRWGHNLTWYVHSLSRGWFHFNLILFLLVPLGTSIPSPVRVGLWEQPLLRGNSLWEKISKNLLSPRLGSGVRRRWDKQASFGKKRQPTGLCLEAYICKEWVSFSWPRPPDVLRR